MDAPQSVHASVMRMIHRRSGCVWLGMFASTILVGVKRSEGLWSLRLLVFPGLSSIAPRLRRGMSAKGVKVVTVREKNDALVGLE